MAFTGTRMQAGDFRRVMIKASFQGSIRVAVRATVRAAMEV